MAEPETMKDKPCGKQVLNHTDCWENKFMDLILGVAERRCARDVDAYNECLGKEQSLSLLTLQKRTTVMERSASCMKEEYTFVLLRAI